MSHPKLLFFAGSARTDSLNKKFARCGAKLAQDAGIAATFLDLRDYPLPIYDGDFEDESGVPENAGKLKEIVEQHDGVFIISPEYNSSIPPLLKNVLDWISRVKNDDGSSSAAFKNKPTALGAVSPGGLGGMRVLIGLRPIIANGYNALVIPEQISVPGGDKVFGDDGMLTDEKVTQRYISAIKSLKSVAERMK